LIANKAIKVPESHNLIQSRLVESI